MIYSLIKTMALLWTLAEGLILIYMRWGLLSLKKGEERQPTFTVLCAILFCCLILLMFGGERLLFQCLDLQINIHAKLYRWGLWNFFCTIWVIIEGIIMIYVWRIYKILAGAGQGNRPLLPGIPLLLVLLLAFYALYEYHLFTLAAANALDVNGIKRVAQFYIRICGFFWILFEWVVAVVGMKTYRRLKTLNTPEG